MKRFMKFSREHFTQNFDATENFVKFIGYLASVAQKFAPMFCTPKLRQILTGVEEHGDDIRFFTGSGNAAVSRMRNEKFAI